MPTTTTETVTNVQEQILDVLAKIQKPVVDAVQKLADRAEAVVPSNVPVVPGAEKLPDLNELIALQFVFAEKLLIQQKEFTNALLDAVKPVSDKVVVTEAKPKAKATKAAAA